MTKWIRTILAVLAISLLHGRFATSAYTLDTDTERLNNAKNFAFEGLDFNTTLTKIRSQPQKFLQVNTDGSEKSIGVSQWIFYPKSATVVKLSFLQERLYELRILYPSFPDDKSSNGLQRVVSDLFEKFGPAADSCDCWIFPSINRRFESAPANLDFLVIVSDTKIIAKIKSTKKLLGYSEP